MLSPNSWGMRYTVWVTYIYVYMYVYKYVHYMHMVTHGHPPLLRHVCIYIYMYNPHVTPYPLLQVSPTSEARIMALQATDFASRVRTALDKHAFGHSLKPILEGLLQGDVWVFLGYREFYTYI